MWFVILGFAVTVYLVTGNPIIACLLPYIAAAWPSAESAFWLRTADPWRERGRVCFWFYLATAGWKAAAAALVAVLIFVIVQEIVGMAPILEMANRAILVLLAGVTGASFLGLVGIAMAFRCRVRVFVIPKLIRLCNADFSNISFATASYRGFNYGIFILATSIMAPISAAGTAICIVGTKGGQNPVFEQLSQTVGLSMMVVGPLAAIPVYAFCSNRIIAQHPIFCWPDSLVNRPKNP
jgi:hypothetical protein